MKQRGTTDCYLHIKICFQTQQCETEVDNLLFFILHICMMHHCTVALHLFCKLSPWPEYLLIVH